MPIDAEVHPQTAAGLFHHRERAVPAKMLLVASLITTDINLRCKKGEVFLTLNSNPYSAQNTTISR